MKKIINILILFVVCFLPVVVDAKANLEFEKEFDAEYFLYEEDGKYYFLNLQSEDIDGADGLKVYDSNNNLIKSDFLVNEEILESEEDAFNQRTFLEYNRLMMYLYENSLLFKDDDNVYFVSFEYEDIFIIPLNGGEQQDISFTDDLTLTKRLLGKSYDIFMYLTSLDNYVNNIVESDGYYVAEYYDNDNYQNRYLGIFDKNANMKLKINSEKTFKTFAYVYDDLVYVMNNSNTISIYKMDGTKIQDLTISHPLIDDFEVEHNCETVVPFSFYIKNNELFILYEYSTFGCPKRIALDSYEDYNDLSRELARSSGSFTLKYSLDFDVETVSSNNGEITYENKVDEDGKSYVELKITPKNGYSVEEIIVTDVNGNRIDVTNNKFYKPMNDVKVEVKYVQGEYLPIPDTFLGKSFTVIIIGLILVGLGFYTINYVKGESKVDI